MAKVSFQKELIDSVTVLRLSGEIDISNAMELKEQIKELSKKSGIRVILNLAQVTHIDSSGLGCIISAKKHIAELKGDLKICELTSDVKYVFELIDLNSIIDIYDTETEALQAAQK